MTIHNFFLTLLCSIWAYVLLCLLICTQLDRKTDRRARQQQAELDRFFSSALSRHQRKQSLRRMKQATEDGLLLQAFCARWAETDAGTAQQREADTLEVLHHRIGCLSPGDGIARCQLLHSLDLCGLDSPQIRQFRQACLLGSPLERYWADPDGKPLQFND